MHTRSIGSLSVSVVGLGCNNFGRKLDTGGTARVVQAALDAGITFFDTADSYGDTQSEVFLGRALAGRRHDAVIGTKFGSKLDEQRHGASPAYIRRAVEDSLRRLNTDRIDLYQLHWPDPEVPIADTLGALDGLVKAGKVREVGCSNFSPAQLREADQAARPGAAKFASLQNEYSLLHQEPEAEVLPLCEDLGMAFIPYFPLASRRRPAAGLPKDVTPICSTRTISRLWNSWSAFVKHGVTRFWNWPFPGSCGSQLSHRSLPVRRSRNRSGPTRRRRTGSSVTRNWWR